MCSNSDDESRKNNDTPASADVALATLNNVTATLSNVTTRQREEILLPPLPPQHLDRKTLVLDLDETLVHVSFLPIPNYHYLLKLPDIHGGNVMYVFKRPGVDEFLAAAAELFEVVVFTAGSQLYADTVLDWLDVDRTLISHRLYNHHCSQIPLFLNEDKEQPIVNVKDLGRLGRDLSKTIIVDNSPYSYYLHPENAVPITSYFDSPDDRELSRVMSILGTVLERNEDVRNVLGELLDHLDLFQ